MSVTGARRARPVARRRRAPRGPRDLRRTGAPPRRRQRHPAAGAGRRPGRRLGGNGFRRAGQPRGGRPGHARRPVRRAPTPWPRRCRRWTASGFVDPGFAMDSAWRGMLPPETGFVHLDDVPARVVLDLAQRGVALAKEYGSAHGPPASLLDQEVVAVTLGRHRRRHPHAVRIRPDRNGFPAAGDRHGDQFAPESVAPDEVVRVARAADLAAHRRAVRHRVPPPRRPRRRAALTSAPTRRRRAAAGRRPACALAISTSPAGKCDG